MSRTALAGLGLCAAALAGAVVLEVLWIEGNHATSMAAALAPLRPVPVVPMPPLPDQSPEWEATALERPLFVAGRRPAAELRPAAGGGRELPRLTGVLVSPTGRIAIFASATEGVKPVVLREGDSLGIFEVKTILIGEVTLAGPEGERVLRPSFDPKGGGAFSARPPNQPRTPSGIHPGFVPAATPSTTSFQLPSNFPTGVSAR